MAFMEMCKLPSPQKNYSLLTQWMGVVVVPTILGGLSSLCTPQGPYKRWWFVTQLPGHVPLTVSLTNPVLS